MKFKPEKKEKEFQEKVIQIRRVSKTVAGGKRFRFSALVVVGDGKGRSGIGLGTAVQTPQAIRKAAAAAEKNLYKLPLVNGTIAHEVKGKQGASTVHLIPAPPGTGVIAGATVRALCEVAGIKNIYTKIRGAATPLNAAKATMNGFKSLRDPKKLAALRGVDVSSIWFMKEMPE